MANIGKDMVVQYQTQGGVEMKLTPDLVINYLVQGRKELVKAEEIVYFMNVCKARRLNPFVKERHIPR